METGRLIDEGRGHPHFSAVLELKEAAETQTQLERQLALGEGSSRWGKTPLLRGMPGKARECKLLCMKGKRRARRELPDPISTPRPRVLKCHPRHLEAA